MTNLFVLSSTPDILINKIISTGDRLVMVANDELKKNLFTFGINSITINNSRFDTKTRDLDFFNFAMPGVLENITFKGTKLPLYKVLSIDRFRFWYHPDPSTILKTINAVNYNSIYIDFNLQSTLPWLAASINPEKTVAFKSAPLTTRETIDFLPYAPISELVVSYNYEKAILDKVANKIKVTSLGLSPPERKKISDDEVNRIKENLNIEEKEQVLGIIFDSRYDWKVTRILHELAQANAKMRIFIFVKDFNQRQKFLSCVPQFFMQWLNIETHSSPSIMGICDEIMFPVYDERMLNIIPETDSTVIADYAGIDLAHEFTDNYPTIYKNS